MRSLCLTIDKTKCSIRGSRRNGIKVTIEGNEAIFKDVKGNPVLFTGKVPDDILDRLLHLIYIYFYET